MQLLIIDDEEEILTALDTFLSLNGYSVETAQDPRRGLDFHREQDIKLVLLDINMPGMDGLEVLRRIIDHDYTTEVVMITGYNSLNKTLEAREIGAVEYLLKPFEDMDEVSRIVEQAQDRLKRWHAALEDGLKQKRKQRDNDTDA